jgi:signal transduction histidine kinase
MIAQLRGRLQTGAMLRRMLSELGPHPSPAATERHMAAALGDPTLRVAYRVADGDGYVDAAGAPMLVPDAPGPGVAELWDDGERVAMILHDPALDDVPGLMDAAGAAALLTVRNARLSAELRSSVRALRASRARIAWAVDGARRELQRDLADGAQSQLASVRARLASAADDATDPARRELLVDLRAAADAAAATLADAAHGIYPRLLVERGLAPALRGGLGDDAAVVADGSPLPRGPEQCEAAVYFACLEAAQNALKHAGEGRSVTVALRRRDGELLFAVSDDGDGFDLVAAGGANGRGLSNMHDRVEAVGGHLTVVSRPGHGTTVSGGVPWPERPGQARRGQGTSASMRQRSDPFA